MLVKLSGAGRYKRLDGAGYALIRCNFEHGRKSDPLSHSVNDVSTRPISAVRNDATAATGANPFSWGDRLDPVF